jgi:HEAT repeat protein
VEEEDAMIALAFFFLSLVCPVKADAEMSSEIQDQLVQTLRYGIDSQVLQAIRVIGEAKDTSLTSELAVLLAQAGSTDVRKAILDLFTEQKQKEGQDAARVIVAGWEDQKSDLVTSAIHYLSAIGQADLAKELVPLMDAGDNSIAAEAIDALGKSQDRSITKLLLAKLASLEFPEERKPQVILALGELKDPAAVDALIAVVEDDNAERTNRLYAADALGKIGDPKAIPVLKGLLGEKDALNRTYAASALARFDASQVIVEIFQGLRDENWKVRLECVKALARPLPAGKVSQAVAILSYKAEFDPVNQVRLEAMSTLAAIGGEAAAAVLLKLFQTSGTPMECRERALSLIAQKNVTGAAADAVRKTVESDWSAHDQKALLMEARILSTVHSADLKPILIKLLENGDLYIRIYAIRGIELNGFSDLKERLLTLSARDPVPAVQKEAKRVADKL